jgi:transposase-like protein
MKRRQYSKEFKAKVALEALKGQKTTSEIASAYEVTRARSTPGRSRRRRRCRRFSAGGKIGRRKRIDCTSRSASCRWRWTGPKKRPDIWTACRRNAGAPRKLIRG